MNITDQTPYVIIGINPAFSGIAFPPKISGKMTMSKALRRFAPSGYRRRHFPLDFWWECNALEAMINPLIIIVATSWPTVH